MALPAGEVCWGEWGHIIFWRILKVPNRQSAPIAFATGLSARTKCISTSKCAVNSFPLCGRYKKIAKMGAVASSKPLRRWEIRFYRRKTLTEARVFVYKACCRSGSRVIFRQWLVEL
jgi:hypothetical protein